MGARDILELPLFAASSKMETALMAGKPDNPAMSPHALDKTGTRHTVTQWKSKGVKKGGNKKPLNAPRIMLLFPATRINKRYSPEQEEFPACASILNPLTNRLQTLLAI